MKLSQSSQRGTFRTLHSASNAVTDFRRTALKQQKERLTVTEQPQSQSIVRAALRSQSGQSAVEFALTLTITLMMIFGLVDFSRAVYAASVIQWAAQQGARIGMTTTDAAAVRSAVTGKLVGLNSEEAKITIDPSDPKLVQVDVSYRFEFVTPIVAQITGGALNLEASASMVRQ
jgi:hypothetical protein